MGKRRPKNGQLYWLCEWCKTPHPWPQEHYRRHCNTACIKSKYYYSKKEEKK